MKVTTQVQASSNGIVTEQMKYCAQKEEVSSEFVRREVASGRAVIPANPIHALLQPVVVGSAFRTKINANIGRSIDASSDIEEIKKMRIAISAGADCVMDLSVGRNLSKLRKELIRNCTVPFGTVPVYETLSRVNGVVKKVETNILLDVIQEHCEQGVDFMTLHAGLRKKHLPLVLKRKMGIVSRGGAILAEWMQIHNKENPLYENWDLILKICRKYDVTLSVGDGLRPGCLADASDDAQFAELETIGELVKRCHKDGVQVMVEGPGHIPLHQIQMNVEKEQKICMGAPFYVLGPVVTDVGLGHDHIVSAIGAAVAAQYGAALLCCVTPSEHLGLPTAEEIRAGVIAFKIAAHAGDIARGIKGVRDVDDEISEARMKFDWETQFKLAIDSATASNMFKEKSAQTLKTSQLVYPDSDYCTMCGREFCAIRTFNRLKNIKSKSPNMKKKLL